MYTILCAVAIFLALVLRPSWLPTDAEIWAAIKPYVTWRYACLLAAALGMVGAFCGYVYQAEWLWLTVLAQGFLIAFDRKVDWDSFKN